MRIPKPAKRTKAQRKRIPKQRKTSRAAQGRLADKLFSLIVRHPGKCAYHGFSEIWADLCRGPLQTAHIVSRTYRSVRWSEDNAFCMCAGAHVAMTHNPLAWERFVASVMGAESYTALKERALTRWDGDLESVLVRLAARAVALGIQPAPTSSANTGQDIKWRFK